MFRTIYVSISRRYRHRRYSRLFLFTFDEKKQKATRF